MSLHDFFHTFGHDIEISERREKQDIAEKIQDWLTQYAQLLCQAYDLAVENTEILSGGDQELIRLAEKTFLYQMLSGAAEGSVWNYRLSGGGVTISGYHYLPYQQLLEVFLYNRASFCSASSAAAAVERHSPLFSQEGLLTEFGCGRYWSGLIACLPPYDGEDSAPEELPELLDAFACAYAVFQDEEGGEARSADLRRMLDRHWEAWSEQHLQEPEEEWEEEEEDPLKDRTLQAFPRLRSFFTGDRLKEMDLTELLGELYPEEPELAVRVWKYILDDQEALLMDEEGAEYLLLDLMEFVWNGSASPAFLLKALDEDDHFAQQVFGSAWVGTPQEDLIRDCRVYGGPRLQQRLEGILNGNPAFHGFL